MSCVVFGALGSFNHVFTPLANVNKLVAIIINEIKNISDISLQQKVPLYAK
jgi:hypothetical protein